MFVKAFTSGPPGVRFNASRAYLASGAVASTRRTAEVEGSRLLRRPEVARALQRFADRNHTTSERAIGETVAHAYSRITDVLSWDAKGLVTYKPSSELSDATVAAIQSVRSKVHTRRVLRQDGAVEEHTTTELELKLVDKEAPLRELRRYHKILEDGKPPETPFSGLPRGFFAALILRDPSKLEGVPPELLELPSETTPAEPAVIDGQGEVEES